MTADPAREEVLARIRQALGPSPAIEAVPRHYRTADSAQRTPVELGELLAERLVDYRATVFRATADTVAEVVADAVTAALDGRDRPRIGVPTGLPPAWLASPERGPFAPVVDGDLSADELDALDGVITGAAVAIAETGTIVLDGYPTCGRRALTLVPDLHVCVVTAEQIVATVPEGIARLDATRPQTWISGPSATSDIELDRVEGVHGPRTLHVVLVSDR